MTEQVILYTIIAAFIITAVLAPIFIPFLRRLKFGQSIRDEGPQSHQKKTGTPTMGGIVFLLSIVATTFLMTGRFSDIGPETYLMILVTVGFGLLGFLDDFIKVVMKRNLGLTSKQKLAGQIVISIIFYLIFKQNDFSTAVSIPMTDISVELGWFYCLFIIFWLVGFSNAVNLTDGLDGLVSGTSAIAFGAMAVLAWNQSQFDVAIFSVAVVGAVLGFLVFNAHPAKVFMGDTGSLALGGAIATVAILTKTEIILILIGGVFVIETLSVILQVASFKTTGKRIFKMSPLHHHYELSGWSEWRVVVTFWTVGLLFAVLGIYIEVWL
ncbi:phospho-N-acetylmuramoyl-pentapeptide-transferase [Rossellomorea marisflavi]|jgi:phospho-N-acetylmuramoyl-pentapeptide-transferase|uniref:Phospho-N-acetylmuramoyl-pentapeptide-transferase n=1 Tax=Rossellomorea marisflavi TaxID=189381 RepID=A0A0M0GQS9_9BACI|nr:phospho-N-acetylmuramoyl-pentapeptide-transferase [Rossellomorea marisflavi]KQU60460.1 phospho-N-acetylmuramoyl-pentapeptide-transferase [Bacillus sp. Leaf406]MBV6683160.1 phospho-N-acetylmuramoyl-pentapeptide-transferase [Bacillus sp. JRC01]VXB59355.1 phospho-N-acetylmuramoyl-pentapeptide undecaprenyl phosphate (C55P) transferase [Bacillus sp. 349Y]KON92194.1 phospho-N-acetylmuramoyl-pentapeptide-transferase [Rossellomorea marisflavi]MCM2590311.1 phospho-N-acetylmuramoyl-pentapeptide-trans